MASAAAKIPVSVIVAAKNEERAIARCLEALSDFAEIIVVDSNSEDKTQEIARGLGARVENFSWNGRYPKKRQWILENVAIAHEWIFFVDADEILTPELVAEIRRLKFDRDGYFVKGRYVWDGKELNYGLQNNKLVLFRRAKFAFPEVGDLDLPMGEIEGHYQPRPKGRAIIGQLNNPLLHYIDDLEAWDRRHERYAAWEAGMNARCAWPRDPDPKRQKMKEIFRAAPCRGLIAFLHSYILKLGFLDGRSGLDFARSRGKYYNQINRLNEFS